MGALAVTLTGGKVLVAGGNTTAGMTKSAEVFDPAAGQWTDVANVMQMERDTRYRGLVALGDGRALLVGGASTATTAVDIYDPTDNKFHAATAMGHPRAAAGAALLPGGKVLVAGGNDGDEALLTGEVYDPSNNTWQNVGNAMPSVHNLPLTAPLPDGRVLVIGSTLVAIGGFSPAVAIYDPVTNLFSATGAMTRAHGGDPGASAAAAGAVTLTDGRVLVIGGFAGTFGPAARGNRADVYYPSLGQWLSSGPGITPDLFSTIAALPNGEALAAGGSDGTTAATASAIYSATTVPSAPASVSALAGDGTAIVFWDRPDADGGLPLSGYTVRASTGAAVTTDAGTTHATFSGLPNGTAVTLTVTAVNPVGEGPAAPSVAVTPAAPPRPSRQRRHPHSHRHP